jgi:serine/threonine protein phosphatase PrpC
MVSYFQHKGLNIETDIIPIVNITGVLVLAGARVVLADGHGGPAVSKYMKDHFYRAFQESLAGEGSSSSGVATPTLTGDDTKLHVMEALKAALSSVDDDMLTGPLGSELHRQGSTSCMLYLDKAPSSSSSASSSSSSSAPLLRSIISANVGDSRAVLARGDKAIDLTVDHKPNDPLERERGEVRWVGGAQQLPKQSQTHTCFCFCAAPHLVLVLYLV